MSDQPRELLDALVIGAGPAGLTAGIYAARAHLNAAVLEKGVPGGQVLLTWKVDNYPGFTGGTGADLAAVMEKQAREAGCRFIRGEATGLETEGDIKVVATTAGVIRARGVIIASGAKPNALGVPGEREHIGRGVSYCATCDGAFFGGLPVAVVGGGDTAVEEAIFLTRFANRVHLIHRRDKLRAVQAIQREFFAQRNVDVLWDSVVEEVLGDDRGVTGVKVMNVKTRKESRLDVQGVFIFVGVTPNSGFAAGKLDMDQWGFIVTDEVLRTSLHGVWAAGDVRSKDIRQISTAVGEGASAACMLDRSLHH